MRCMVELSAELIHSLLTNGLPSQSGASSNLLSPHHGNATILSLNHCLRKFSSFPHFRHGQMVCGPSTMGFQVF